MGQPATAQEYDPYAGNEAERPFLKDGQQSHELHAYPVQPPDYPGEAPAPIRRDTHRSLAETVQKPKWAPPGSILRCYQQANYCTILQWVMSFFVMGTAASVVDKREYLESTKPFSITALALGIWFILTLFFRLRYKAASPSTAKPSTMYVVWTGIYLLLWGAALGCSIALMVIVKPYDGERDTGVMSYDCGKSAKKPCHPFTNRGRLTTNVSILLSFCCAGFAVNIGHIWALSKLWRKSYTEDQMRVEYESIPKMPKVNFRESFKEGWRKGWDAERAKG